ncbi:hypothetical protein AA12717_0905 [Gluconacetobacter sacchari DSM 12717]|uniref:Uncharacterized protein n=1 Tax=Gluconacetobacter sacchari DSM 12717 TaxID=1307940 RepID=A0ABQ0P4A9_9PROT|nr:hypothetical protein AA12717_0905 [Gluconacetobacter sacchari DSM 12717]
MHISLHGPLVGEEAVSHHIFIHRHPGVVVIHDPLLKRERTQDHDKCEWEKKLAEHCRY